MSHGMNEDLPHGIKFILDVHLGKLARNLRLLGFDSYWNSTLEDPEIISISLSEKRTILTRDKGLLNNSLASDGFRILSQKPADQLAEVVERFGLKEKALPFTRCLECNGKLKKVPKEMVTGRLYPGTIQYYSEFMECEDCGRIYWEGSHYERMRKFVDSVIKM